TDVTGFGLLGHLGEVVRAGNLDATLALPAVPLLHGLAETVAAGISASLQRQNDRARRPLRHLDERPAHPLYPAVYDPQTAPGLLGSVAGGRGEDCVGAVRVGGYGSGTIVGSVEAKSQALAAITVAFDEAREPSRSALMPSGQDQREEVRRAHEPVL